MPRLVAKAAAALLAALFCVAGAPARAEWQVVHSEAAHFVEFDPSTVRDAQPFRLVWTRVTFTTPQEGATASYQSQGQLHAVDCAAKASTVIGLVNYSGALGQGAALERQTRPRQEWQPKPPPPGSLAALIIERTCREPRKGS